MFFDTAIEVLRASDRNPTEDGNRLIAEILLQLGREPESAAHVADDSVGPNYPAYKEIICARHQGDPFAIARVVFAISCLNQGKSADWLELLATPLTDGGRVLQKEYFLGALTGLFTFGNWLDDRWKAPVPYFDDNWPSIVRFIVTAERISDEDCALNESDQPIVDLLAKELKKFAKGSRGQQFGGRGSRISQIRSFLRKFLPTDTLAPIP
mgnify:CR=1 FL=1